MLAVQLGVTGNKPLGRIVGAADHLNRIDYQLEQLREPQSRNAERLMARMPGHPGQEFWDERSTTTSSWDFVERVTRIELALSAWEVQRSRLPGGADQASLAVLSDPG